MDLDEEHRSELLAQRQGGITLRCTQGVLDLIATMYRSGHRITNVTIDDDSYVELRYWADPIATPAQVARAITTALAVVTADPSGSAHSGQRQSAGHTTPHLGATLHASRSR